MSGWVAYIVCTDDLYLKSDVGSVHELAMNEILRLEQITAAVFTEVSVLEIPICLPCLGVQ